MKRRINPDLLHLTCLIHTLHHVCEKVRSLLKDVSTLVKNGMKIFLKCPLCVTKWKQYTDLVLLTQVCATRWGMWFIGTVWYSVPARLDTFK